MINISFRQLQYFVALARAGSFSGAARQVGITQSSLSAAIQALEQELQIVLVDRSGRVTQLLPAGEELLSRAQQILALVGDLPDQVRSADRPLRKRLRLGAIPSVAPFLLPKIMPKTAEIFPALKLTVREGMTHHLLEALKSGSLDVALLAQPYRLDGFEFEPVAVDPFYVAVQSQDPLARRQSVSAADLTGRRLLLLESGHCLRSHVVAAIGSVELRENDDVHAASIMTLVQMVGFGMGTTLLPEIAAKAGAVRGTDLQVLPFEGENNFRTLVLVWRAGAARRQDYRLFAQHLRQRCLLSGEASPDTGG